MKKIILLDWDGPVSNSRTWSMPGCADPVAIQLLNEARERGWETVLTSTIRKNHDTPEAFDAKFAKCGLRVDWFDAQGTAWRTKPGFTTLRHLEFLQWYSDNQELFDPDDHTVFLAFDDENYPDDIKQGMGVLQWPINADEGIPSHSLRLMRKLIRMTDEQLLALDEDAGAEEQVEGK